jgi:hypothetical protein
MVESDTHKCVLCKKTMRHIENDKWSHIRTVHKACYKRRAENDSLKHHHETYVVPLMMLQQRGV